MPPGYFLQPQLLWLSFYIGFEAVEHEVGFDTEQSGFWQGLYQGEKLCIPCRGNLRVAQPVEH